MTIWRERQYRAPAAIFIAPLAGAHKRMQWPNPWPNALLNLPAILVARTGVDIDLAMLSIRCRL
jgi:hypothetical protein